MNTWIYTLSVVGAISLLSLIGVFFLSVKRFPFMPFMVSFAAGAMLGDVFLHLLPHLAEEGFGPRISFSIIGGMITLFALEKFINWQHCHHAVSDDHPHTFTYMNLIGDAFHNLIDGMLIAGSFLVSVPLGISTAIAVALHEIPQEIGDFGVLIQGGFSTRKALLVNLLSGLTALVGAVIILIAGQSFDELELFLSAFTAGTFIYIATADLIPELHKETKVKNSLVQVAFFLLGVAIMYGLLLIESGGH